ncbi:hypothetical protein Ahy_B07g086489 [Arachis hypogaea]|uniref:Aminotransferase-like plant mobile domain-containing protein n=1 Tax=Arachis hypogaea TaxID=3818 RepID=A0A444Y9U5_ARAHY|nr:hypothetical protein Ahy_B07g086489 [Arachis hypogaea]
MNNKFFLYQPNRNLMVRKLDPPETWNLMVEDALREMRFYHVSRIWVIREFYPLLSALVERWRLETRTFVLPVGEVTVTLEDVAYIFSLHIHGQVVSGWTDSSGEFLDTDRLDILESIQRYIRCQIFYFLGSTLFADKLTVYAHAKYLPLLHDFNLIQTYSWGQHVLALYRASHYDTKEMDDPLNILFVWTWERMPCIVPVPRQYLPAADVPVARRWSHFKRISAWLSKTTTTFRQEIDYMKEPYEGVIIPDELHRHLEVCNTVAPLLSFECVE